MTRRYFPLAVGVGVLLFTLCASAHAQQRRLDRVGVVTAGGAWYEVIDGLRVGLQQLQLEEGKQFNLAIRDTKGIAKAAEEAASSFEREKVSLVYTTQTSVTLAAKRSTKEVPIVFCAGADPVELGLVESFARGGGRLTGVFYRDTDLTAKRLEILKEIIPKLRRAVTFYNPNNPVANESAKVVRGTAGTMGIQLIERHVTTVEELQSAVRGLRAGEADAIFEVSDALTVIQDRMIVETAITKKLPTMFINHSSVTKGGLASYSVSRKEIGRLSAKYVQRILAGVKPHELPVEGVDKIDFVINLKAAKQIGLTIPVRVLERANQVIK
jgi:putative ABC transport system substrate-binding protein